MLRKESKIRILENFKALDYVFFGKPVKKMVSCCPALVEEYLSLKGALSSVLVEMYDLVQHSPKILNEAVDVSSLVKAARHNAKVARENAQKLVVTEKGKASIKKQLTESLRHNKNLNIEEEVKTRIREKAFSLAVDNLLIARSLHESTQAKKLNTWEGKIVEDAYKVLRKNLVESAMFIIEANEISK